MGTEGILVWSSRTQGWHGGKVPCALLDVLMRVGLKMLATQKLTGAEAGRSQEQHSMNSLPKSTGVASKSETKLNIWSSSIISRKVAGVGEGDLECHPHSETELEFNQVWSQSAVLSYPKPTHKKSVQERQEESNLVTSNAQQILLRETSAKLGCLLLQPQVTKHHSSPLTGGIK